ncbi:SAM-dependent methyltransferase [Bacillus sp. AFS018417]|uniref:class I SAM-dependent methyltransferase n=1 Tax=unclassified Bacillus (in: firmicutes) TaxID=185979 RepID=UPI000BF59C9E|nr:MULTISPECIES: class I SAM-dependent methyltransferase [unclassified Bacillus (in: firmicutes)]MCP1122340.1 class I SAM-dependent methyltransferase [Bacillus sp. 3103sda1]PEZ06385.1 SAM-dependent methyltransferase [Bacillus sp. AFS018417]
MKNKQNQKIYKILSSFYDLFMQNRFFIEARKRALSLIPFTENQKILLVGVGTGQDIPLLPKDTLITGIDLSEHMLKQAKRKYPYSHVTYQQMNAEELTFPNNSFDVVILNLILSVVEHPNAALSEALRVMKEEGTIVILDKFLSEEKQLHTPRKLMNFITERLGTNINRKLSNIIGTLPLTIQYEESSIFHGNYRIVLLKYEKKN